MKGINYITDSQNKRTAVIIDIKTLERFDERLEDLFDIIIAESRKDEPTVSWETVKRKLKKQGKL